ncbi:POTRA domain-containing protein [Ulvibacter litoralis]|uniref:POTRA domain-containing protein n=1 Tax=Ulvibacter litoralis TaxID=227084 RepID=A0A1G7C0C6_9FLAO|nr:POTRA domain-containing protein [Ulvibacter litoralis]GHC49263.1 membrane protein [Ulvibacter litoralis]SDE32250.1 hypothetical protein SAMN05421855_10191 [Ulvibacter litoralis]
MFLTAYAQNLTLSIKGEVEISETLTDSLQKEKTFNSYKALKAETDSIFIRLQKKGFLESKLQKIEKENDSLYSAHFYFGKKYSSIKVYYSEETFSKRELSLVSSEITDQYFILPFELIEAALQKLNNIKSENGNTFAKLSLKNISIENNTMLSASLASDKGVKRTVDSIAVKGYEKFPRSYLKHYAGIRKGKTFSKKKINSQNELINNLPFATSIKAPEVLFRKDTTVVYFYLKKRNANQFDGVIGFATDEETQKLQLNGYLNLELNNNLNYGEQLLINYKEDGDEQRDIRVKASLPYLFKSPFGVGLELKIFRRDSTFITTEQQARVTYQINPTSNSYIGYKGYESSNLLDETATGSPIEDFTSKFVTVGASYTKSQSSSLFPVKTYFSIDTEIGSRDLKNTSDDQIKLSTIVNHIFNLNYKNSFFIQNSTNLLISDNYLTNELYRFGGITNMRGFSENSIDASLFSVLNTEYRYQFNTGLYLHSIIDIGYFENQTLDLKEKLYSYGIGLGLETKAGLLRLNIANGTSENKSFNFSNTKIHLILSSRF